MLDYLNMMILSIMQMWPDNKAGFYLSLAGIAAVLFFLYHFIRIIFWFLFYMGSYLFLEKFLKRNRMNKRNYPLKKWRD